MPRILPKLVKEADGDTKELLWKLIDDGNMMQDDYNDIYHEIVECDKTPYGAAKAVFDSGRTVRSFRTLQYHAQNIVVELVRFFAQITPMSVLEEFVEYKKVQCPDELVMAFEKLLRANDLRAEKWSVYYEVKENGT